MTAADLIVHSYQTAGKLLHRMVDDLTPEEFAAQPVVGANSAAWVVGHLASVLAGSAARLGGTGPSAFPAELAAKVQVTRQMAEAQSGIGDPTELVALFDAALGKLTDVLRTLPAEQLTEPQKGRAPFASNQGEALLFGATHIVMHTGQLSTLRRSLGKPPTF